MAASALLKLAALALLACSVAADPPVRKDPWPRCEAQYNWYWCQKQLGGAVFCRITLLRNTGGPLAVNWVPNNNTNDDYGYALNCINFQGVVKCSLRFCSYDNHHWEFEPWNDHRWEHHCEKNWFDCRLEGIRTVCDVHICPRNQFPILPRRGRETDWFTCTWNGVQVDCYISNLTTRKIRWSHGRAFYGAEPLTPAIPINFPFIPDRIL